MENTTVISSFSTKRVDFIDVFRGIGIVLMVIGHIKVSNEFDILIHSFHMPIFFFISGYLYKKRDSFKDFLVKKSKTLLIPYLFFGVVIFAANVLLGKIQNVKEVLVRFFWDNSDGGVPVWALWFLTALFFAEAIYFLLNKLLKNELLLSVAVVVISVLGNVETLLLPFRLPWSIGAALVGVGLYHIGAMIKKYENRKIIYDFLNMKWYWWIVISFICLFLIFVNGYVNMRGGEYSIIPLFWINAVLASGLLFNFSRFLNNFSKHVRVLSLFCKWLKSIGKNSIIYVGFNQLFIMLLKLFESTINLPQSGKYIILFAATMLLLGITSLLFSKTGLKVLVGKQKS